MFSPTQGRFITADPIGFQAGDVNLYRYVGNNPANFTDPSGLKPDKPTVAEAPDKGFVHMDQELFQLASMKRDPNLTRAIANLRSLYNHPAVDRWIVKYANEHSGTDFFFGNLRMDLNAKDKEASRRSIYIYLGHGSKVKDVREKALASLEKALGDATVPVKNKEPVGPIVIYPTCFNGQWYKLLPDNMKIPGGSIVAGDDTITGTQMAKSLSVDLVAVKLLLDDWVKSDKNLKVTVTVIVGHAGNGIEDSRLKNWPEEFEKQYSEFLMEKWLIQP